MTFALSMAEISPTRSGFHSFCARTRLTWPDACVNGSSAIETPTDKAMPD